MMFANRITEMLGDTMAGPLRFVEEDSKR
jgi:hypothetical protein